MYPNKIATNVQGLAKCGYSVFRQPEQKLKIYLKAKYK
jgi:hypothetical protein